MTTDFCKNDSMFRQWALSIGSISLTFISVHIRRAYTNNCLIHVKIIVVVQLPLPFPFSLNFRACIVHAVCPFFEVSNNFTFSQIEILLLVYCGGQSHVYCTGRAGFTLTMVAWFLSFCFILCFTLLSFLFLFASFLFVSL